VGRTFDIKISDVPPRFSGHNLTYKGLAYSELFCESTLRDFRSLAQVPDLSYLIRCKLRHFVGFSALFARNALVTAFRHSVSLIDKIVSKKQMLWVYTGRIVAFVQNVHTCRNWTVMKNPRGSVSKSLATRKAKAAISLFLAISIPFPTPCFWDFIELGVKSVFWRAFHAGLISVRTPENKWVLYGP